MSIESTKFGLVDTNSSTGLNRSEVLQLIDSTLSNATNITTQSLNVGTQASSYQLPPALPVGNQIIVNRLLSSVTITSTNNFINYFFQTYGPRVISIADGTYTLANLLTAIVSATNAFFAGIPDATTITWAVVGGHIQVTTVGKTFSIFLTPLSSLLGLTVNMPALVNSYTFLGGLPATVQ